MPADAEPARRTLGDYVRRFGRLLSRAAARVEVDRPAFERRELQRGCNGTITNASYLITSTDWYSVPPREASYARTKRPPRPIERANDLPDGPGSAG